MPQQYIHTPVYDLYIDYFAKLTKKDVQLTSNLFIADYYIPETLIPEPAFWSILELFNFHTPQIHKAVDMAKAYHTNMTRLNGEPYFEGHILSTCVTLMFYETKTKTLTEQQIIKCILHDVLEDNPNLKNFLSETIKTTFGEAILADVLQLTKVSKEEYELDPSYAKLSPDNKWHHRNSDYSQKLLKSNYDVRMIKCSDRLLNLQDDINHMLAKREYEHVSKYYLETKTYFEQLFTTHKHNCNPHYNQLLGITLQLLITMLKTNLQVST